MAPMQPGGVIPNAPRIPRGESEIVNASPEEEALHRVGGPVLAYHREQVREARIVGFAAGVVIGVGWMLLVLFVADRVIS